MVLFPTCKLNLGLNVIRRRPDGYHDLQTVFYPIPLHDALEILVKKEQSTELDFSSSGFKTGSDKDNLCVKAWDLLSREFSSLPSIRMHLHKAIPPGAGLGAGSSDGAFTLKAIDKLCGLNMTRKKLLLLALELGSDCPFFIINKPCYAEGRGELLEEIQLDLSAYNLLLVKPAIHISTAEMFKGLKPAVHHYSLRAAIEEPIRDWKTIIKNDFEEIAFEKYPSLKKIKDDLYQTGAIYSSMSGSGSTVFGIFPKEVIPIFDFPKKYFTKLIPGK